MSGNQFASEDHHKTLGVSQSASDKEIKQPHQIKITHKMSISQRKISYSTALSA